MLNRFSIDSYEREIECYGGTELINFAETLFCFDSIVVEDILKLKRLKLLILASDRNGFHHSLYGTVRPRL